MEKGLVLKRGLELERRIGLKRRIEKVIVGEKHRDEEKVSCREG